MANRLCYHGHAVLKSVERFMKHYFLVAKDVGDLTRILCAVLEDQERKKKPGIGRFMQKLRRKKTVKGFKLERGRLDFTRDEAIKNDPINLIRIFHVANVDEMEFRSDEGG